MPQEIERKFLVADRSCVDGAEGVHFKQGYLPVAGDPSQVRAVARVRVEGARAVITLKGRPEGLTRSEYEYEIPVADAEGILAEMCDKPLIEKTRYRLEWAGKVWEVDVFAGENAGLVVAEVELTDEGEVVAAPPWAGAEVTGDPRYYNANLIREPYCSWKEG